MYRVTKQFMRGLEETLNKFPKRAEAEAFIQARLIEDARMKVQTIYRIYDDLDEVVGEFTAADIKENVAATYTSSSQSQGKAVSFNPTPFNLKPQPGSFPHSWVKDTEENS